MGPKEPSRLAILCRMHLTCVGLVARHTHDVTAKLILYYDHVTFDWGVTK
jgi:hypothetical protein